MRITLIRLVLHMEEPGGVSAPEDACDTLDLPLARDHAGRPWIPPASMAGVLRRVPGLDADVLFGYEDASGGRASRLWVQQTMLRLPDGAQAQRSGRTAMDRGRGAPRPKHLFSSEVLPVGSAIEVLLRWDDPTPDELAGFNDAIRVWRPQIGRGATIGLGRCRPSALGQRHLDLNHTPDLVAWLSQPGPQLYDGITLVSLDEQDPTDDVLLDSRWRIADALHIGSGEQTESSAGSLVARTTTHNGIPEVPGSSWKGVLRSRCEYILNSVGVPCCSVATCGSCPTCTLFGHGAPPRRPQDPPGSGRVGCVRVLRSPIEPDPTHGAGALPLQERAHVAIDRFTGGAHRGLLYTKEVVVSGSLRLQVRRNDQRPVPGWARGLLLAAVRDIADGLVGIGGDTSRGHGTLNRIDEAGQQLPALTVDEHAEMRHAIGELTGKAQT